MKNIGKTAAVAAMAVSGLGLCLSAMAAEPAAGEVQRTVVSNAIDKCQAFTPGPSNTIRNRVIGAQNIGGKAIAVACSFELPKVEDGSRASVDELWVWLKNGDATKPINVSCTAMPGTGAQIVAGEAKEKSIAILPNTYAQLKWTGIAQQDAVGVNCILPPLATLSQTGIVYHSATRQPAP